MDVKFLTIGYKKVVGAVLTLEILGPTCFGRMSNGMRTSKVRVLKADLIGSFEPPKDGKFRSMRESSLTYKVGEVTEATSWDEMGNDGIHYFWEFGSARYY